MPLAWNAWGLPFLVSASLSLCAGFLVYVVGPRRTLNRALAATLVFGAVIQTGYGLGAMSTTREDAYAFGVLSQMAKFVIAPAYLVFLSAALRTPLVRPFQLPAVRALLVAFAILAPIAVVLRPTWFVGEPIDRAAIPFAWAPASLTQAYDAVAFVVFVYALVCTLAAYRSARPGTPSRERDRWFVIAFGTRDLALASFLALDAIVLTPGDLAYDVAFNLVFAAATTASVAFIVYGVLKWHLFDIDVKIKWTLRRGTLAAVFLGVFLVATEIAQQGFAARFGWIWGGLAAGVLLFALVPLQRMTQRFADAAMPHVSATDEYLAFRRGQVYKGALEEILVDGVITPKERAILDALQQSLGLADSTASAIERDVRAALAGRD